MILHPKPWKALGVPSDPKIVRLHAQTFNAFDGHDNLRNALKPVVDGLKDARIIDDDADRCGHTFSYTQEVRRSDRGVWITIERSP